MHHFLWCTASCFLKADGDKLAGLLILKQGQMHDCLVRAQNESSSRSYRKIQNLSRVGTLTLWLWATCSFIERRMGNAQNAKESKIKSQTTIDHEISLKIM